MKKKPIKKRTLKKSLQNKLKNKSFKEAYEHYSAALEVGYMVRSIRKKVGLTQVELAKKMGVSQQVVSKLEHGEVDNPTINTLQRIAAVTGAKLKVEFSLV
ncbi:MAG: helix-turn-helix transcriptional regulator [Fibrobacteria bacterium]|nr:helix-turn-helix transcriptional regulator [Fibrobacteria bacterium]